MKNEDEIANKNEIVSSDEDNYKMAKHSPGTPPSREQKKRHFKKPPLRFEITKATDGAEPSSPESEDDILGVLDHTPDVRLNFSKFGQRSICYSRVYDLQTFSELMPHVYIRDQHVTLSVVKVDHLSGPISFLNQHVLTILLQHGDCQWIIKRKAKQITSLHSQLRYFKAKLKIPAATAQGRERRQSLRDQIKTDDKLQRKHSNNRMVKFPRKELQRMEPNAKQAIETYMRNLLHHSLLRSHHSVLEFFEISPLSFVTSLGTKLREGYVGKKSHTNSTFIGQCFSRFKAMWLVLKESCLFLVSPSNGQIRTVMLMDVAFQVSHGFRHTGVPRGLRVTNLSRSLVLRCDGGESEKEWASSIENVRNTHGDDFIRENRFSSFTPVRINSKARWYVDGSWYMNDVADLLELAQEEIYITGWWLSPDIYMKRPDLTGKYWMLSEVLKRQAERGIKIFILLYKEVEFALGLNSLYSKHCLSKLSPNIKVLRHPDHLKSGALYWAHHEKLVVIDQMYAFIGGIDMCYGRWDNYQHKLVDIGHGGRKFKRPSVTSLGLAQLVQGSRMFAAGILGESSLTAVPALYDSVGSSCDAVQPLSQSKVEHGKYTTNRESEGKIDAVENIRTRKSPTFGSPSSYGGVGLNMNENLPSLGGNSLFNPPLSSEKHLIALDSDDSDSNLETNQDQESKSNWNLKTMKAIGIELMEEVRRKRGKFAIDRAKEKLYRSSSADSEIFCPSASDDEERQRFKRRKRLQVRWKKGLRMNRRTTISDPPPRKANSLADLHKEMHYEEASSVHLWVGKDYNNWIKKDLYDPHSPFKDTVNRLETPRMPWHDIALYTEGEAARDAARHFIQRWNSVKNGKVKKKEHYPFLVPKTYNPITLHSSPLKPKHRVKCQVLRSVGPWSAGIADKEQSIYAAYLHSIKRAKHYIYIENQFFITSCHEGRNGVHNNIGLHLFERILRAHKNKETFRVYLVIPLLPAFAGLIGTRGGTTMQYIIYYIYCSIIRGRHSLIGRLVAANVCWQNYLTVCSTRTHGSLDDELVSELIYIHSKLLIVDDRIVIAGSANINDRSMMGDRDSELAMIIEDTEFVPGRMNSEPYERGEFAGSLRMYLFSEHLGVESGGTIDLVDPVCDRFFKTWQGIASRNTKIYEEVFNCIPCDSASTFAELRKIRSQASLARKSPETAKERLHKIQGHLVLYPLLFLQKEPLKPGPGNKEFLLPEELWT